MNEIVLVDDDDEVREMLAEVLREAGYFVYEAENGKAALERLEALNRPCVLVVDVMMPVMDGPDLLRALQQSNRLATLTVLALSAGDVVHQVQLANAFLPKPVLPEELLAAVRKYCPPEYRA
jgi:CheY-like chemotaxis protein